MYPRDHLKLRPQFEIKSCPRIQNRQKRRPYRDGAFAFPATDRRGAGLCLLQSQAPDRRFAETGDIAWLRSQQGSMRSFLAEFGLVESVVIYTPERQPLRMARLATRHLGERTWRSCRSIGARDEH